MLKSRRGISLTTMVITVMVMLVIMGTLVYSAVDSVKIRKLNKLYNDLRQLDDAVGIYYLQHGELPVYTESSKTIVITKGDTLDSVKEKKIDFVLKSGESKANNQNSFFNPNDYDTAGVPNECATYKFINLDLLDDLSLNYPTNEYIVNTKSHTVYNYTGLTVDGVTYNALPLTYKDTQYNENHKVSQIRLKSVSGLTAPGSTNYVYLAYSAESLNLKDLLVFDSSGTDGLGEPKDVVFKMKNGITSNYFTLNESTGVLTKKDAGADVSTGSTANIIVTANSYGDPTERTIELQIESASINVYTNATPRVAVDHVNLIAKQTQSTYKNMKTSSGASEYTVQKNGVLNTPNPAMNATSTDSDIATATYSTSSKMVVFSSGTKAGSADVTIEVQGYGMAKDTVPVNVYDFQIYAGSAGSNTNISKLDITGLGDDSKTNVKLNIEGPNGFNFSSGANNNVQWSIVKEDGTTADTTGVVELTTSASDKTTATITPKKVGKTYLRCILTIEGEVLGESLIPINVSGIEVADGTTITNDTISLSKSGTKTVKLKYSFPETPTGTVTYETPTVTPASNFNVTKNNDNTFTIQYTGSSDVTATVSFLVKVGTTEYKDTVKITVAN